MSLELPRPLGPFFLLRHLASGGMGEVYLAHQKLGAGERLCVVKTVRPEVALDETMMQRFLDEAKTSAFLMHKNVAAVLDVGRADNTDNTAYLAVEHVAGRDLQSVLRKAKREGVRVAPEAALHIACELLDGLAYVHQAVHPRTLKPLHIVHRDVSPHNVMVAFTGEVKIIDFGIARSSVKRDVTQAGQAIGKVRYMAPEQARAEPVDAAADVWSAAIVLTELFTQKRFWGELPPETILMRVAAGLSPRTDALAALPDGLRRAVQAGLDVDKAKRPTAAELRALLVEAAGVHPSSAATRALLQEAFAGEEEEERRAHALLLQEPTTVHASALWSRTAQEETPADGSLAVDADAPTASHLAALGTGMATVAALPPRALDVTVAAPPPAPPPPPARRADTDAGPTRTAAPRAPRRGGFSPLASLAGAALAVCLLTAGAIVLTRPAAPAHTPEHALPLLDAGTAEAAPLDAGVVDAAPVDAGVAVAAEDAAPVDAGVAEAAPVDAGGAARPVRAAVHAAAPEEHRRRPRPDVHPEARPEAHPDPHPQDAHPAEKPVFFGDRVKALRMCAKKPPCAEPVLRRAAHVAKLSLDELRALDGDVDWCLAQCQ